MFYDYHVHTNFSSDSPMSMEEMIEAAIDLGLLEIAFCDHVDFDLAPRYQLRIPQYLEALEQNRLKYKNQINIVKGLEIGFTPKTSDLCEELSGRWDWDFIIASTHIIEPYELYLGDFFKGKTKREAFEEYFLDVLNTVKSFSGFSVYGHLDYVNRYSDYPDNSIRYRDFSDVIDELLLQLIQRGKGLEVNSSGYRYGLNSPNPSKEILIRYKELGGEIITVGSDAHHAKDVAKDFSICYGMLKEIGFNAVTLFRNKEAVFADI